MNKLSRKDPCLCTLRKWSLPCLCSQWYLLKWEQHYNKFSQNKQKIQYTWPTLTYRLLCNGRQRKHSNKSQNEKPLPFLIKKKEGFERLTLAENDLKHFCFTTFSTTIQNYYNHFRAVRLNVCPSMIWRQPSWFLSPVSWMPTVASGWQLPSRVSIWSDGGECHISSAYIQSSSEHCFGSLSPHLSGFGSSGALELFQIHFDLKWLFKIN